MKKNKKVYLILIACLVGVLLFFGIFIGIRNVGNNSNVVTPNDDNNEQVDGGEITYDYKLVKMLEYELDENEKEKNSPTVLETKKHYIVDMNNAYNSRVIVYDKDGNNVTKKLFGTENIYYINDVNESNDRFIVQTNDGKSGLFDSEFNELIKIGNYEIWETDNDNYFMVGNKLDPDDNDELSVGGVLNNVGLYDKNGKLVIPRGYERLYLADLINSNDKDELLFARKNGKYGVINVKNEVIIPFEYDRSGSKMEIGIGEIFTSNKNNYFIMNKNGKYGLIANNKVIIDFNKNKLIYNKNANAIIEVIENTDGEVTKLNAYDLNGELKKEIKLGNGLKVEIHAYHYSQDDMNLVLYDDNYVYVLNKEFGYDKYKGSYNFSYGMESYIFLSSKNFYLKGNNNNEKFQIYKTVDDSLMFKDQFYFLRILEDFGIVLCKGKNETECGIIGNDGELKLDFKYDGSEYSYLENGNEIIEFDEDTNKLVKHVRKVDEQCFGGKGSYYFDGKIINLDGEIYDYNCNKLADDISNLYSMGGDLFIIESFRTNGYNMYSIYDLNTFKLVNIENPDNVVIINEISDKMLVATDKGIYRVVKK